MKVNPGITSHLQKWRVFLAIAESGSVTRAALSLGRDQGLLSRQLTSLERECGTRFFTRNGRGVVLSEAGVRILPHVRRLLEQAECLEAEIARGEQASGVVTIACLPSLAAVLLPELFNEVQRQFPHVQLKIIEAASGQIEEWLADGKVDLAVLYRYGHAAEGEQLASVDSFLVGRVGDPLTATDQVDFSSLAGLPLILPGAPNGLRTALDAIARAKGITLRPVLELDTVVMMRSALLNAPLYSVLPLHAVMDDVRGGRLQAARIVSPRLRRFVCMEHAMRKAPPPMMSAIARELANLVKRRALA